MTTEDLDGTAVARSARERSQLVARALSEAARRARVSTRGRRASGFGARRGERLMRLATLACFIGLAVLPSLGGALYFGLIASDQYVSEARFAVRGGSTSKQDTIGAITGVPSVEILQDTQILVNYLESRAIVEALQSEVDIIGMFSRPEIDYFSRLDPQDPIEDVVSYWKSMIDVGVLLPAEIVNVEVRAFTPGDAFRIARAVLEASERLVNEMNARMRKDNLALSEHERQRAGERLARARAALEQARNEEGLLSVDKALDVQNALILNERTNLLKLQQDYEMQRHYMAESSPQLRALKKRIEAEQEQIAQLTAQLTRRPEDPADTKVLSGTMTRLQHLDFERQVAETAYTTALRAYERARVANETQHLYITTFVRPLEANEARYPKRPMMIGIIVAASFAAWGALMGVLGLVRNHMAK